MLGPRPLLCPVPCFDRALPWLRLCPAPSIAHTLSPGCTCAQPQVAPPFCLRPSSRFAFVHARAPSSCSMCDPRIVPDCSAPGRPAVPECSRPLPRVLPPILPDVTRYSPSFCRPSVSRTNDLPHHGRLSSTYRLGTDENVCGR